MIASEAGTETVWQVALEQSKYWKSVNPKACEPRDGITPLWRSRSYLLNKVLADVDDITFSIPGTAIVTYYCVLILHTAEILKGHRQHFLYAQYQMLQIPMIPAYEERYGSQAMCTYESS